MTLDKQIFEKDISRFTENKIYIDAIKYDCKEIFGEKTKLEDYLFK